MKVERSGTYNGLGPVDGVVDIWEEVVVWHRATGLVVDGEGPSAEGMHGQSSKSLQIRHRPMSRLDHCRNRLMALSRRSWTIGEGLTRVLSRVAFVDNDKGDVATMGRAVVV